MRYIPAYVKYFIPDGWSYGSEDIISVADASNNKDCERKFSQAKIQGKDPTVLIKENNQFDNLKLVKFTEYRKYASTYNVMTQDGYHFAISDALIFDCAMNADISLSEIKAPFIWANHGGMNLIRVGSVVHANLLAEDAKLNAGSLKQQFGCVYKTRNGQEFLFLGKMDGVYVESYSNPNYRYGYNYSYSSVNNNTPRYLYKYVPESGFLYSHRGELPDFSGTYYSDTLVFVKTRKPMYEFVKDLKLQANWLDVLKDKASAKLKLTPNTEEYTIQKLCRVLNLGYKDKVHPEVDKIFAPLGTKFS